MSENIEIQSNTLINVLTNKITQLTNENLVQASIIEEMKMKLISYEEQYEVQEEIKNEE